MIVAKKQNRMTANKFRLTMLTKAVLGLPEMENRETVGQNLSEDDIYVGGLEDSTEATGNLEGVGDLGGAGRANELWCLGGFSCYISTNFFSS